MAWHQPVEISLGERIARAGASDSTVRLEGCACMLSLLLELFELRSCYCHAHLQHYPRSTWSDEVARDASMSRPADNVACGLVCGEPSTFG